MADRDYTKYNFNGKTNLPKNRLVLEVIKKYVDDHLEVTFDQVRKIFPRSINGSIEIVELLDKIKEKNSKRVLFFVGKDEPIQLANGEIIVVTTEWGNNNSKGVPNIQDFIKKAEELGYEIAESTENENFFPNPTDKYDSANQNESDLPTADEFLFAFIQFFSKKSGYSENQKKILQFHLNQESYSTTARIITENLGLTNIGHANMLCGHLAKGLCQILGKKNLRYFVEILFDFKKTNDFNNELQWILHSPVVEALNKFFSMSEEEKNIFIEKKGGIKTNYWIFQGNPKHYDVVGSLKNDALKTWTVTSFKNRIQPGDKVILWVTGKESGCYALCKVDSEVYEGFDPEVEEKYYKEKEKNTKNSRVTIKITHNLVNNPILKTDIAGIPELSKLKAGNQGTNFESNKLEYEAFLKIAEAKLSGKLENKMKTNQPLNLILYGPPGTGKTYNTFNKALEIIDGFVSEDREECEERFSKLRKSGQIEFITFHQSYSYEDFVEGIKPDVEKEEMKFKRVDGIFKNICKKAKENYEISQKSPEEINESLSFLEALETVKELVINADKTNPIKINDTAYFLLAEDDAFRYSADNWTLNGKGFDGFRMKYSDLIEFYKNDIQERSKIKNLSNISGLAKQHASYFFKAYEIVKNHMKNIKEIKNSVEKQNFVLIIDEINRGNISRIFGELITLIEEDKRDGRLTVKLPYSQEDFTVPSNLFIIGTMNTADRSIALLDIALRRRFTFFRFDPDSRFVKFPKAKNIMEKLNEEIVKTKGKDFQIGHSYFMKVKDEKELKAVIDFKIKPLLEEYFVNDPNKLDKLNKLVDDGFRND